jgi:hypothetical protein
MTMTPQTETIYNQLVKMLTTISYSVKPSTVSTAEIHKAHKPELDPIERRH